MFPSSRGPWSSSLSRRGFLGWTSLAAAAAWSDRALGVMRRNVTLADSPFQLGVASGDPSPSGFVLWTRLAPRPLEGGGMPPDPVEVSWEVAEDEQFERSVQQGTTTAVPDWGHSVHVEVDGLRPDRWYWYRFRAGGDISPVGRTRTFPMPQADPARLRFAFASCQNFEEGLFTAYEHMAQEDLDCIVHLGDYIYEGSAKTGRVRQHNGDEIVTLEQYRNRHALYRTDVHLQQAHRLYPWIVTWDDHEVDNNYANDISEERNVPPAELLVRRAIAYQAYYEHMPLRRSSLPAGPSMRLYRDLAFGRLARWFVLDTRQYRTDQPCGDGEKPPCDEMLDARATLLGDEQERWLLDGLATPSARWNVVAQQVMMARVDQMPGPGAVYSMDQWPGYELNRRRVLKAFHERKVVNPVVITGDIHSNWANNLVADFDDLNSQVVATEFVGTSISSGGDGRLAPLKLAPLLEENPFVRFHSTERGYVRCEVTPDLWRTDFRAVPFVTRPGSPVLTRASFVVEDGQPGLKPA